MVKHIFLFCLFASLRFNSYAQIYIAGDTIGKHVYNPYYTFANAGVVIEIDCNDSADLGFWSHPGGQYQYDWTRLTFTMAPGVEVLNSQTGFVSHFKEGDTIQLTADVWTPALDFIYGTGGMGPYGQVKIDSEYIAFRKIWAGDTNYVFLKVYTSVALMSISKIISDCPTSPLTILSSVDAPDSEVRVLVYPSRFRNSFNVRVEGCYIAKLYNLQGRMVMQWQNLSTVNTSNLPAGFYLLHVQKCDGQSATLRVVKD